MGVLAGGQASWVDGTRGQGAGAATSAAHGPPSTLPSHAPTRSGLREELEAEGSQRPRPLVAVRPTDSLASVVRTLFSRGCSMAPVLSAQADAQRGECRRRVWGRAGGEARCACCVAPVPARPHSARLLHNPPSGAGPHGPPGSSSAGSLQPSPGGIQPPRSPTSASAALAESPEGDVLHTATISGVGGLACGARGVARVRRLRACVDRAAANLALRGSSPRLLTTPPRHASSPALAGAGLPDAPLPSQPGLATAAGAAGQRAAHRHLGAHQQPSRADCGRERRRRSSGRRGAAAAAGGLLGGMCRVEAAVMGVLGEQGLQAGMAARALVGWGRFSP